MSDLRVVPDTGIRVDVPDPPPITVLRRVVGEHGSVVSTQTGARVVMPDQESARWVITTLDMLGFASSVE